MWVSNQLAKDPTGRKSGVISWPGSNVPINGYLPYKVEPFDFNRQFDSMLQRIFEWFSEPSDTRINFGAVYYFQPDLTGKKLYY